MLGRFSVCGKAVIVTIIKSCLGLSSVLSNSVLGSSTIIGVCV